MLWLCIRLTALAPEAQTGEREALERLAAWAYQWSSLVTYRLGTSNPATRTARDGVDSMPLLWLELAASRALFGEPHALLERISNELTQLGYSHACAIAPCAAGAALLARTQRARAERSPTELPPTELPHAGKPCALTRPQLLERLASLPLDWLELPLETRLALHSAGLRRIGEVLALPSAALARRFGTDCCRYLARLTGRSSDPRPAFRLPDRYRARRQFDQELHTTTALLFPLQRLLQEFQGYLRARDRAVQRFTLQLEHARELPATCVTIQLAAPARDAARFLLLVREHLQSLALPAPVRALLLQADAFTAPSIVQRDLFGESGQLEELAQWLERLRARLGEQAVCVPDCRADHRPERAGLLAMPEQARASVQAGHTARPAALLSSARRIERPDTLLAGPERIESGWWDGEPVRRDYYVARAADGAHWWVFHDLTAGGWYLQGLWI